LLLLLLITHEAVEHFANKLKAAASS